MAKAINPLPAVHMTPAEIEAAKILGIQVKAVVKSTFMETPISSATAKADGSTGNPGTVQVGP